MFPLLIQPELPHPQTDRWQEYGIYTILDFLKENWFYLSVILILIIVYALYLKRQKKVKESRRKNRSTD